MWHDDKINDEAKLWLEKHGWIWNVNGYWVGMRAGYIMCHNVSSAVLAQMRSWTLNLTSNSGTKETRKRWYRNIDEAVVLLLRLTLEEGKAAATGKVEENIMEENDTNE